MLYSEATDTLVCSYRTDHLDDYILERTAMPDEKIRKADGNDVFEEESIWVSLL